MLNPYDLLGGVLNEIEKGLKDNINEKALADKFFLSNTHLRRLFKFTFRQPLGSYIRSRKLAASIDDLLRTDKNILDIIFEYGFEYEQSYIRTFKREFGITPGELRKSGQIVKITPPLQLLDSNKLGDGLFFGPDIVMIPQFHVVGKKYKVPFRDALVVDPSLAHQFFHNERMKIQDMINPDVHINICFKADAYEDYSYSMPSVQVKNISNNIPKGCESFTFPTSLCANFRFIGTGNTHLNMAVAEGMFNAIDDFMDDERQQYFLERKRINFEKILSSTEDGFFNQWEWFAPVVEKKMLKFSPHSPSGIKKITKQKLPALRFIGKKCIETTGTANILGLLDNWQLKGWFDVIEKQSNIDFKTFYDGSDSYINLVRKRNGSLKEGIIFEHWMGMFTPKGTKVPDGYEVIEFPKLTLVVCSVYGKKGEITGYENECRNKLAEEGFEIKDDILFFRRFNWHSFFEDDIYGKRLLEYCYFL